VIDKHLPTPPPSRFLFYFCVDNQIEQDMSRFRQNVRKIPGSVYLYRKYVALRYRFLPPEDVFTEIYEKNLWGGELSRSGPGSDPDQTGTLIRELPKLFQQLGVRSILDIPCGDFKWMSKVDLNGISYHGADIVEALIEINIREHQDENKKFSKINLLEDPLPEAELILCRDCLVHLSYDNIFKALKNISQSRSKYLLTTTFSSRTENRDIVTGQWRPINLQIAPFSFPEPIFMLDEVCIEADGIYRDKMLALWETDSLKQMFANGNPPA
jgi:hypothetical protein